MTIKESYAYLNGLTCELKDYSGKTPSQKHFLRVVYSNVIKATTLLIIPLKGHGKALSPEITPIHKWLYAHPGHIAQYRKTLISTLPLSPGNALLLWELPDLQTHLKNPFHGKLYFKTYSQ